MKARLNIDTISNSNVITENLKLFSTTSPGSDQNIKKTIFNNLINSKKNPNENLNKNKFDSFKLNMLINGKNTAVSPIKDLSRNPSAKNNFNSLEWKGEFQYLTQKFQDKNKINYDENFKKEKINNIKSDIFKLLSKNSVKKKNSNHLENFLAGSKKSLNTERLQRMKTSVNKFLERDFSLEKNLVKEKMKKNAELCNRESTAIKSLKMDLYKSASKKSKLEPSDDLYFSLLKREHTERNFSQSNSNWNRNSLDTEVNFFKDEKVKNFDETFSTFRLKSFGQI